MAFLARTQETQMELLHRAAQQLARIETVVESWKDSGRSQDDKIAKLEDRVASLESDRKTVRAILALTWGALTSGAAVLAWLLSR